MDFLPEHWIPSQLSLRWMPMKWCPILWWEFNSKVLTKGNSKGSWCKSRKTSSMNSLFYALNDAVEWCVLLGVPDWVHFLLTNLGKRPSIAMEPKMLLLTVEVTRKCMRASYGKLQMWKVNFKYGEKKRPRYTIQRHLGSPLLKTMINIGSIFLGLKLDW